MGFELSASVAGFALLGLWIDRRYDTGPWGVLIGSLLGVTGGLYNLIRTSLRLLNPGPSARKSGDDHER
jgi:F0F1-type ATP synthase assembly protein I